MSLTQKSVWAILHWLAIAAVLVSLGSGLRIAVLEYPWLLRLNALLPQGEMHGLHLIAGWSLTLLLVTYTGLLLLGRQAGLMPHKKPGGFNRFHFNVGWALRLVVLLLLGSGWLLYIEAPGLAAGAAKLLHFICALCAVLVVFLHGSGFLLQSGRRLLRLLFQPLQQARITLLAGALLLCVAGAGAMALLARETNHRLQVTTIKDDIFIEIDGRADEAVWSQAKPLTLTTHGGANFDEGATPVTLRALQNGSDMFLHFRWQDVTESLEHLPLVKTDNGWQVRQDGFQDFDEKSWYEDKFAVIVSNSCEWDAAGTAHLGPKPLGDKPKHWTGQGYHYREQGLVDLWQWKAVRTNAMKLMDDNYIATPAEARAGDRRYTAGYQQDANESGAYKMNWRWYSAAGIVPKRLPLAAEQLLPYQASAQEGAAAEPVAADMPWVMPWFDTEPYQQGKDNYPVGTVMPSILYSSNQFEGDRAHVRAYARWQDGYWSLEVFRRLDTGSDKDVALRDGVCLWVAAFDRAQIRHTRHVRPIALEFQ